MGILCIALWKTFLFFFIVSFMFQKLIFSPYVMCVFEFWATFLLFVFLLANLFKCYRQIHIHHKRKKVFWFPICVCLVLTFCSSSFVISVFLFSFHFTANFLLSVSKKSSLVYAILILIIRIIKFKDSIEKKVITWR